ncbi:auxin-responsive protein IAA33 [Ananas comosus]|uniref:Auxin-responsive protein n=1 Tax=Ananas comosus TaxID=4615 RepID=A0A199W702_ANACO|nr:auxin-responsive protein IAA33 [Ananas comosus]OAY84685.1 Auxin-responsive protein IAA33 [Ananas comosus]
MMNMSESSSLRNAAKRPGWDEKAAAGCYAAPASAPAPMRKFLRLATLNDGVDDAASAITPPVTVVLEGRSICHRIHLHKHGGYQSLAAALRRMFVDTDGSGHELAVDGARLDLSNAVPGYLVAYEDMEDDLLLAGDLNWKDFVRVAKRIRIIPAKASTRKKTVGA